MADQIIGAALTITCAVILVTSCLVVGARWAERTCRRAYHAARVPFDDAEAAELEAGIREDLHMDPVVDVTPPIDWAEHQRRAWLRLLLAVEESPDIDEYVASEAAWIDEEWLHFDERSAG